MKLAEALKKYREKHGFSQVQMARLVGVNRLTIWNWETGRYRPNQKAVLDRIRGLIGKIKT